MSILNFFVTTEITETLFMARRSWTPVQHYYFKALLRTLNSQLLDRHLEGSHTSGFIQCRFGNARMRCFAISYKNEMTVIISYIHFNTDEFDPDDGLASQAHDARYPLYIYNVRSDNGRGLVTIIDGDPEFSPPITNRHYKPLLTMNSTADGIFSSLADGDNTLASPPFAPSTSELSRACMLLQSRDAPRHTAGPGAGVPQWRFESSPIRDLEAVDEWSSLLPGAGPDGLSENSSIDIGSCVTGTAVTPERCALIFVNVATGANNSATRRNGHVAAPPRHLN